MSPVASRIPPFLALAIIGCATTPRPTPVPKEKVASFLPWLTSGATREKVLLELGTPSTSFEGGRLCTYLLRYDPDEDRLVTVPRFRDWSGVQFDLVLVFATGGRLTRHRLIRVK